MIHLERSPAARGTHEGAPSVLTQRTQRPAQGRGARGWGTDLHLHQQQDAGVLEVHGGASGAAGVRIHTPADPVPQGLMELGAPVRCSTPLVLSEDTGFGPRENNV